MLRPIPKLSTSLEIGLVPHVGYVWQPAYYFCSRRKTKDEAFLVYIPDIPWQEVVFSEQSLKLVVIIAKSHRVVGKDSLPIDLCTKLSS